MDLREHDCWVSGEVGWLRRPDLPTPWWPAQKYHRSDKALAASGGVGEQVYYLLFEDVYHHQALEPEDSEGVWMPFALKTMSRSTIAKAHIFSHALATLEIEEQDRIRDCAQLFPVSYLEHWAKAVDDQTIPVDLSHLSPTLGREDGSTVAQAVRDTWQRVNRGLQGRVAAAMHIEGKQGAGLIALDNMAGYSMHLNDKISTDNGTLQHCTLVAASSSSSSSSGISHSLRPNSFSSFISSQCESILQAQQHERDEARKQAKLDKLNAKKAQQLAAKALKDQQKEEARQSKEAVEDILQEVEEELVQEVAVQGMKEIEEEVLAVPVALPAPEEVLAVEYTSDKTKRKTKKEKVAKAKKKVSKEDPAPVEMNEEVLEEEWVAWLGEEAEVLPVDPYLVQQEVPDAPADDLHPQMLTNDLDLFMGMGMMIPEPGEQIMDALSPLDPDPLDLPDPSDRPRPSSNRPLRPSRTVLIDPIPDKPKKRTILKKSKEDSDDEAIVIQRLPSKSIRVDPKPLVGHPHPAQASRLQQFPSSSSGNGTRPVAVSKPLPPALAAASTSKTVAAVASTSKTIPAASTVNGQYSSSNGSRHHNPSTQEFLTKASKVAMFPTNAVVLPSKPTAALPPPSKEPAKSSSHAYLPGRAFADNRWDERQPQHRADTNSNQQRTAAPGEKRSRAASHDQSLAPVREMAAANQLLSPTHGTAAVANGKPAVRRSRFQPAQHAQDTHELRPPPAVKIPEGEDDDDDVEAFIKKFQSEHGSQQAIQQQQPEQHEVQHIHSDTAVHFDQPHADYADHGQGSPADRRVRRRTSRFGAKESAYAEYVAQEQVPSSQEMTDHLQQHHQHQYPQQHPQHAMDVSYPPPPSFHHSQHMAVDEYGQYPPSFMPMSEGKTGQQYGAHYDWQQQHQQPVHMESQMHLPMLQPMGEYLAPQQYPPLMPVGDMMGGYSNEHMGYDVGPGPIMAMGVHNVPMNGMSFTGYPPPFLHLQIPPPPPPEDSPASSPYQQSIHPQALADLEQGLDAIGSMLTELREEGKEDGEVLIDGMPVEPGNGTMGVGNSNGLSKAQSRLQRKAMGHHHLGPQQVLPYQMPQHPHHHKGKASAAPHAQMHPTLWVPVARTGEVLQKAVKDQAVEDGELEG